MAPIIKLERHALHQTARYAVCTGFMALGMMIPGMWSVERPIARDHRLPTFLAVGDSSDDYELPRSAADSVGQGIQEEGVKRTAQRQA